MARCNRNPESRLRRHVFNVIATEVFDKLGRRVCFHELELPAAQWLPPGPRGIPAAGPQDVAGTEYDFRAARPVGGVRLDHAFTDLARDADGRFFPLAQVTADTVRGTGPDRAPLLDVLVARLDEHVGDRRCDDILLLLVTMR